MMFNFLRKRNTDLVAPPQPSGFFSTHGESVKIDYAQLMGSMKKSFQRTHDDLVVVSHAGLAMDSTEMKAAMDSFDMSSIQQVKLLQSSANGGALNFVQFDYFASQGFIGYQTAALLSQHWLIEKCCYIPAKDAVRHGYKVTVNDGTEVKPEVLDEIARMDKKFKVKLNCIEFIKMGRVFGIRIAMFKVRSPDPKYYEKPFNPDGVMPGSYEGISQIDPYWITPELDGDAAANPSSIHFYEPTWWRVNGTRIHRSHLVIFRNGDVPDILKPTYVYGGISVPQKVMERVYAAERTANEGPLLALTKRTTVIHVAIEQAMAQIGKFLEKMQQSSYFQNNFGIRILGKEEVAEQFDTSLADLDNVTMMQYQLVAAAGNVPAVKLIETSPKGFNATGEYEESSYHETLESIQEIDLTPLVDRHHLLLIRSYIVPKFGIKPFSTDVFWNPVDSPTAKEQAETNLVKAQTDAALVGCGAIDGYDVRQRIIADTESGYNGIPDIVDGGPGDREAEQEAEENEDRRTEEAHQESLKGNEELPNG